MSLVPLALVTMGVVMAPANFLVSRLTLVYNTGLPPLVNCRIKNSSVPWPDGTGFLTGCALNEKTMPMTDRTVR